MDMCVSGQYTRPLMSHAPIFPFFGPAKFNVSIKPGKSAAQSIQFKVRYTLILMVNQTEKAFVDLCRVHFET